MRTMRSTSDCPPGGHGVRRVRAVRILPVFQTPRRRFREGQVNAIEVHDTVCSVPTVLSIDGYRFFFFSNEGTEPPHIHVERGDGYAKFWLEPVELVDAVSLGTVELRRARLLVIQHRIDFREKWR